MKIEELVQLLDNRLREFRLSRDYARMSGDLERMNAADKEIIGLEDTLYQLNLLVDVSKSATVKENVLADVLTDGSVAVLGEYDITPYATDSMHEQKIMNILSKMGVMDTVEKIDAYIKGKYPSSPVTGEMVMSAALAYNVDTRLLMAMMQQDSSFGTAGLAVSTLNPGNVGNDDDGNTRTYNSWQEGVTAVAEWLNRHRGSTPIYKDSLETAPVPVATSTSGGQATSTSPIILPTTSTSTAATTTPVTATSTGSGQASSTDSILSPQASGGQTTSTPVIDTSFEDIVPVTTATSTPATTSTSTPVTIAPVTATSTPATDTSAEEEEIVPVTTSTSTTTTTTTATTTPVTATSTVN